MRGESVIDARRRMLSALAVAVVGSAGVGAVAPALPGMASAFSLSPQQMGYVVTAYAAPRFIAAPIAGRVADRVGRRPVLLGALGVFAAAGVACALAPSFGALLVLRMVQGTAGAALRPTLLAAIADGSTGTRRHTLLARVAAAGGVAALLYPLIGGSLAAVHWRLPFLLMAVGLVALALVAAAPARSWRAPSATVQVSPGGEGTARRRWPPHVVGGWLAGGLIYALLYGPVVTYLPAFAAGSRVGPAAAGALLSIVFAVDVAASLAYRPARRYASARVLLTASFGALGAALFVGAGASSIARFALCCGLVGVGTGVGMLAVTEALLEGAGADRRGAALGLFTAALGLGQALGPLAAGAAAARLDVASAFTLAGVAALLAGATLPPLLPRTRPAGVAQERGDPGSSSTGSSSTG